MKLSVAIPIFNEAETLPPLIVELRSVLETLDCDYEILFVNDGSDDDTLAILTREASSDPRIKVLILSRNFGHQVALTAALDFSTGDAVVIMDGDLQDPPELLPEMIRLYRAGYDIVSPQRISRQGDSWVKQRTASLFYWVISKLTENQVSPEVGDFRLLSRRAVVGLRQFREQRRFVRGLVGWMGLREILLPFHRRARLAGSTKYPWTKMARLSWVAVTSLSSLPLRLSIVAGFFASGIAILYFLYAGYAKFIKKDVVQGWTSIVFLQCFFFGVTLLCLGILGQYIAHIYEEARSRPLYVLSGSMNIDADAAAVARAIVLGPPEGEAGPGPGHGR
jgi:glycosyltransferase involved in cell wall biosynthesis